MYKTLKLYNFFFQVWNTQNRKLVALTTCNCTGAFATKCVINALAWHPNNTTFVR